MRSKKINIISGIHRSGTTFIGKLININKEFNSIHEPLNFDVGIKNNEFWYPYHSIKNNYSSSEKALLNIANEKLNFKKYSSNKINPIRTIFKTRGNIEFLKHKFLNPNRNILYKDPFMSLCGNYFLDLNKNSKILFLIRHPNSFYYSNLKMGWDFDFNLFPLNQILKDYSHLNKNIYTDSHKERLFTLYNIIYNVVFDIIQSYPNQTLLIRHEDFSLNPEKFTERICEFFDIEFSNNHQNFIKLNMKNDNSEIINGKQFNFKRNSRQLAKDALKDGIQNISSYKHIFSDKILKVYR